MDYIKIRFGNDFDQLESKFETIEEMLGSINPIFRCVQRTWKPQMDIYETPKEIFILAEVAGVSKENLEIEISSKAVKIYGNRSHVPHMDNTTYRLAEIQFGRFERILYLPAPIDTDNVKASYLDGLLKVQLVKMPAEKPLKIKISEG